MHVPSERGATAAMPRSMPVAWPVSGTGCTGTAAHEKQTYQPSASVESVTVLGAPSNGRDQRTRPADGETPDFRQDQESRRERGPIATRFGGERVGAVASLVARDPRLLARLQAAKECLLRLVASCQHIWQDRRVEGGVLRKRSTDVFAVSFLLVA
jgi:hypothetical protein